MSPSDGETDLILELWFVILITQIKTRGQQRKWIPAFYETERNLDCIITSYKKLLSKHLLFGLFLNTLCLICHIRNGAFVTPLRKFHPLEYCKYVYRPFWSIFLSWTVFWFALIHTFLNQSSWFMWKNIFSMTCQLKRYDFWLSSKIELISWD